MIIHEGITYQLKFLKEIEEKKNLTWKFLVVDNPITLTMVRAMTLFNFGRGKRNNILFFILLRDKRISLKYVKHL